MGKETDMALRKWKRFAIKVESSLSKEYGQVNLLPNLTVFWTGHEDDRAVSINISLFVGEVQFWFGDVADLI